MPAPIPVLLMVRELNLGGSERQMAEIAKALDRSRFDPRVGCFRPAGLRADDLRAAGVPIVQFPVPSLVSVKGALRIAAYVREHRHTAGAHLRYTSESLRRAGRAYGRFRGSGFQPAGGPGAMAGMADGMALRLTDRLVDGIVVNCEFMRRHLRDEEKVPAGLIHLCYNGIDTGVFQPGAWRAGRTPCETPR